MVLRRRDPLDEGPFRAHKRGVPLFVENEGAKHVIAELFELPGKIVYAEVFWPRDGGFRVVRGSVARGEGGWAVGPCTIHRIGDDPQLLYLWREWRSWRVDQETDYNRDLAWDAILENGVVNGTL